MNARLANEGTERELIHRSEAGESFLPCHTDRVARVMQRQTRAHTRDGPGPGRNAQKLGARFEPIETGRHEGPAFACPAVDGLLRDAESQLPRGARPEYAEICSQQHRRAIVDFPPRAPEEAGGRYAGVAKWQVVQHRPKICRDGISAHLVGPTVAPPNGHPGGEMGHNLPGSGHAYECRLIGNVAEALRIGIGTNKPSHGGARHREAPSHPRRAPPRPAKELAIDALCCTSGKRGHAELESCIGGQGNGRRVPEARTGLDSQCRRLKKSPQRKFPQITRGYSLRAANRRPQQRSKPAYEHAAHGGS